MKQTSITRLKDSGVEWIGKIPEHWSVLSLQSIFENINEANTNKQMDFVLSLVKDKGVIPYNEKGNVGNKSKEDLTQYKIARKNDLILNKMNAVIGSIGLSKFNGLVSPIYMVLRVRNTNTILPQYFNYVFSVKEIQESLSRYAYGIMKIRESIDYLEFKKMYLPIPPLNEQKQIIEYLDNKYQKIQKFIEKKEKTIKTLEELEESMINEAVTKGLDKNATFKDSGVEWMGKIPAHWNSIRIGLAFDNISSGTTPKSNKKEYYKNGNISWINSGDLNDSVLENSKNYITQQALNDYPLLTIFPKDSLVIAMYGATIGKTSILNMEACVNQACCVLYDSLFFFVKFAFYTFRVSKRELIRLASGGGQPNVNQEIIRNFKIPLPPLNEQERIAEYLDKKLAKIDLAIKKTKKEIELMKEYKTNLINEAVRGKINL